LKIIAIIALGILSIACNRQDTAPETAAPAVEPKNRPGEVVLSQVAQRNGGIEIVELEPRTVTETISATGELTVNEDRTWSVGAHIEGRIREVFVKPGDIVSEGAVLAHIHSHEVHDSRADYRNAQNELNRAKAAAAQAQRLRDRAARLLALKAGSQQELDAAQAHLREAENSVRNAETEIQRVRTHIVEYLGVPLDPKPDGHGDEVPITAPHSGVLLDRKVSAGSVVAAGQDMFRITDLASVWMLANVAEADLQFLRVGQPVQVLVRAHPDRVFNGRILRLGEELDPTTRTLKVRVLVPNPGRLLKPEMYATAEIERQATRTALFVPEGAVQELNANQVVFVQTAPERFEARPLQSGRAVNGGLEVLSGLKSGDRVVAKGSFVLKSQMLRGSLEED
jgi:cobalt-zinc-cadmium efflux system membrane fusion protein